MKQNNWFKETFLPSFEKGKEKQITEKQMAVFERYSDRSYEDGYTTIFVGEGFKAYWWRCITGTRYYVTVN